MSCFIAPGFVPNAIALVLGHGPVSTLFLSLILFLLTLHYTVWPGRGATYTSGLESTSRHHALTQKYHLPLTPPPP